MVQMLVFLLVSVSAAGSDVLSQEPLPEKFENSIRSVRLKEGQKLVALTFDLCEGPHEISGFDRDLVDFLRANSVKATFFAGGKWMRSHPEQIMELMRESLFEIGNHSWSHANFRHLSRDDARDEVIKTQEQYAAIRAELLKSIGTDGTAGPGAAATIQPSLTLFRFPYGACTDQSLALLARLGIAAIQWNIVSGDPAPGRTAAGILATVMPRVKPGSIIIFHANGKGHGTLQALRELVPRLRGRGYEFAKVGEMLAAGEPMATSECYETTPGDTVRYDRLGGREKGRK